MTARTPDRPTWSAEDRDLLIELANTRMPFGKCRGRLLLDLPEPYLAWFARGGFPRGKIGGLLESTLVIETNGLEPVVRSLVRRAEPKT